MASKTLSLASLALGGAQSQDPLMMRIIRRTTLDQFTGILPAKSVPGITNTYRRTSHTPIVKILNVGGTICEGAACNSKKTDEVGRLIGQPSLDVKVITGHDVVDAWSDQLMQYIPRLQDQFATYLINGTGATDGEVTGLKKLVDVFGTNQRYKPGTTTANVPIQLFHLDVLLDRIRGSANQRAILVDPDIYNDIKVLGMAAGGNTWSQVMVPYAMQDESGAVIRAERPVQAYDGVPIYKSPWLGTDTTNGATNAHRVIALSLEEGTGVELFYPESVAGYSRSAMGMTIDPPVSKPEQDEMYMRLRWLIGLSAYSTQAIAQIVNIKKTN